MAQKIRSPRIFYFQSRNSFPSHSSHAVNSGDFWLKLLNNREVCGSFALLAPQPDNWVNNAYFPEFWDRLKLHMGRILLEVDVNPESDGVIVVDRGHMVKFNSSLPGLQFTSAVPQQYAHDTPDQAIDAYVRSGIPLLAFLQKSGDSLHILPEVIITKSVSPERILVSQTQPLLEEELQTGGLQIGDEPLEDRPIKDRIQNAELCVRRIPELHDWFVQYTDRMKSEQAPN